MSSNSEIRFYMDTMIVEALLSDHGINKKADDGTISQLTESVKNYVGNHINPEDRTGSLLNMLAPGAISILFKSMGFGKVGLLFGLAASVFHIDVKSILSSIYDGVKSLISNNKPVTSSQVDSLVNSAIQSQGGSGSNDQIQAVSASQQLKDVNFLKLALLSYDKDLVCIEKNANLISLASRKDKTLNILGRVLSWIFKIALSAAGFMVAGDAVNKLLGRPNSFDGTINDGKPIEQKNVEVVIPQSKQTKFPLKPGFVDTRYNVANNTWIEKINNNKSNIENMLLLFAKEVYDGLDGQEAAIRNSSKFNNIVEEITWYNHSAVGDPIVFIPKNYISKKQLVDSFIDDVANKSLTSPNLPQSNQPQGSYLV